MLLAGGATELARRNAIVKRLPSVEYNAWGSIDTRASAFSRASLPGARQLRMLGLTIVFTLLMVELPLFQRLFGTESLDLSQGLSCAGFARVLRLVDEAVKFVVRRVRPEPEATPAAG